MAGRRRATLKEVASLAQVSIGTASRALNNTGYVSSEAKARVLAAANQLSYQPNLRARGLRKRTSWSIGLIIPDLLNAYYTALADTASQLLSQQGYHLLLSSTRDDPATEQSTLYDMVGQSVEGLIWVPTAPNGDLLTFLDEQEIPSVAIVRRLPDDRMDSVVFEDLAGSKAATRHLIRLGHTRIGYIGGDATHTSNYDRWQGYLEAHREAGLAVDQALVKLETPRSTWGLMATPDLLQLPEPPTALFVGSNGLMPGVMRALRQYRVAIPDEMSLICFDDVDWFSYSVPPITAIKFGHEAMAEMAVNLLLTRIQHPADLEKRPLFLTIDFDLVVRNSTVPPKQRADGSQTTTFRSPREASENQPWFERVLSAIRLEEPDRVPSAEVWVDPEVKDAFMGYPVRSLKDDVEYWRMAGYDFIALEADLYSAPQIQQSIVQPLLDTADAYVGHRPGRNWVVARDTIATWEKIESFPWPKADDIDLSHLSEVRHYLPSEMGVLINVGHVFTSAMHLMGFETFCLTLCEDVDLVSDIVRRLGEETLLLIERALSYKSVGVVCFQDDIAYTSGLMISPRMLDDVFFPWLRKAAALCHDAGRPMLFHSDGKLDEALPVIVDCGVDGIQAIEPKCMDIAAVKRDWGDKLALMGNVDLGYTLTRGTPREVQDEVRTIIHHAGPGGGLLVGSANSITNYVPLENYKAMLDAVLAYGSYPIAV